MSDWFKAWVAIAPSRCTTLYLTVTALILHSLLPFSSLSDQFQLECFFLHKTCSVSGSGPGNTCAFRYFASLICHSPVCCIAWFKSMRRWLHKRLRCLRCSSFAAFYSWLANSILLCSCSRVLVFKRRAWQLAHNPVTSKRMIKMMAAFFLLPYIG